MAVASVGVKVEIREEYDVVIVGGGTAGVFAADAAARAGARTLLVEKNGMLGGTITSAYINHPGIFNYWGRQLITGPCFELLLRVEKAGGLKMPRNDSEPKSPFSQQIRVDSFLMAVEMERLCRESGVQLLMHTMLSYAQQTKDGIDLLLTCKEGLRAVRAKKAIDCTGDANLAGMLGYEKVRSEHLQPATYANRIDGYDIEAIDEHQVNAAFENAIDRGYLDKTAFSWKKPYKMLKQKRIDMHIPCRGAETSVEKTEMELSAHETLARMLEVFRGVKGCENIKVTTFAAECGIRETCRIVGEQTMTAEKYLSGYVYDDAICFAFYPIDVHTADGIRNIHFDHGVVATVPYRAMIPKGSAHILVAGRTASSDSDTNSAVRVQAPCMAMGTAAGVAAALAAAGNVSVENVNRNELVEELKKIGATVPEK